MWNEMVDETEVSHCYGESTLSQESGTMFWMKLTDASKAKSIEQVSLPVMLINN